MATGSGPPEPPRADPNLTTSMRPALRCGGEGAWLDCTSPLTVGRHVVISQGAYLCCGMHDWHDPGMGSVATPIVVEDGAWIAAFARIGGNVTIGQEAMVAMGSVVFNDC